MILPSGDDMDLKELQKNWDQMGRQDPFYGVLSHREKFNRGWGEGEFFKTGREEIDGLMARARARGWNPSGKALDFGCAVGRLTQALCPYFEACLGVDIAPSMLEKAVQYNRFPDKCLYILNEKNDLALFPDAAFDFIYSALVLQHMAPVHARNYIAEFLRVLKPSGLLVFQVPSRPRYHPLRLLLKKAVPKPLLRAYRRWRYGLALNPDIQIEMNFLPRNEVLDLLARNSGQFLEEERDYYWVRKADPISSPE